MLLRFARLTILTAAVGLLAVPAAHASTHVFVQLGIPAPVYVRPVYVPPPVAAPYPGYVWRAGYYVTTPYGPRWIAGAWVPRAYYYRGDRGWGGHERWEHERWEHERREHRGYERGYDRR